MKLKKNLLDSFDKNKVKCEGCGRYFELKLVPRVFNSKTFRDYWKMPHDIKICSYLCWEACIKKFLKDNGVALRDSDYL
jgi:hypothetical protein